MTTPTGTALRLRRSYPAELRSPGTRLMVGGFAAIASKWRGETIYLSEEG